MIPNIVKGANMYGLIRYLVSEGRANEHEDPHVVGGDDFLVAWYGAETLKSPKVLKSEARSTGAAEGELAEDPVREITAYLEEPRLTFGTVIQARVSTQDPETGERRFEGYKEQNVWHCSLSLRADEGALGDDKWQRIASEFMDEMGFTEASGKSPARWVAIHHGPSAGGNDHIHIAASMVREDGTRWEGRFHDFKRAQDACRGIEKRHSLETVGSSLGISERGTSPADQRRAMRTGAPVTEVQDLGARVRAAATASSSEAEWIRRVRNDGVVLKPFFAKGTTDVVSGYRAALRPSSRTARLRFYGGGTLGRDLSITRLRELWPEPTLETAAAASAEWQAAFRGRPPVAPGVEGAAIKPSAAKQAHATFKAFNERLVSTSFSNRTEWADAARDVSGAMSAWARIDSQNADVLRAGAATLGRSAQVRREPLGPGRRRRESPMPTTFVLLRTKPEDRLKVMTAVMIREVITTATALASYHHAAGDLRQALALREGVVARLEELRTAAESTEQWAARRQIGDAFAPKSPQTMPQTEADRSTPHGAPLPRKLPGRALEDSQNNLGGSHER